MVTPTFLALRNSGYTKKLIYEGGFLMKLKKLCILCTVIVTTVISLNLSSVNAAPSGDGIARNHIIDYANKNKSWTTSDWAGRDILYSWCYGMGIASKLPGSSHDKETIYYDGKYNTLPVYYTYTFNKQRSCPQMLEASNDTWGVYMMRNDMLRNGNPDETSANGEKWVGVKKLLTEEFDRINKGSSKTINITKNAIIDNGEKIIGYQYLHGTNSGAGGFKITGTASKDYNGNVTANLFFEWNDVIDPNFYYSTDAEKAQLAKQLPGAIPTDYILKIGWTYKVNLVKVAPAWWEIFKPYRSSWPFVSYEDDVNPHRYVEG